MRADRCTNIIAEDGLFSFVFFLICIVNGGERGGNCVGVAWEDFS